MISTFNIAKLTSLLKDFYNLTQIRITVFDDTFQELAAWPMQIAPFCRIIRTDAAAAAACKACDRHACDMAAKTQRPYTYRCHAGLTESIAPLVLGNITIGYLLFGHVFSYATHEEGWLQIHQLCHSYQLDLDSLKTACYAQPVIGEDYISSATHILQAVASFLCLERLAGLQHKTLPVQIDDYINSHFTESLNAAKLCEKFAIGKTQLYEISRQLYGTGIAEQIRFLRIQKARQLLTASPGLPLAEIASQCGFSDYNYFITVFKRLTGLPPKEYRKKNLLLPV